jgi:CHASE3 domain sensor protein
VKNFLALVISFIAIGAVSYWGLTVLIATQGVDLSFHGKIAMGLGIAFTMLVGFGLMSLLFYSNRAGHDETVYHLTDSEEAILDTTKPKNTETDTTKDKSKTL